jgi:vesicle-fusing ATPase
MTHSKKDQEIKALVEKMRPSVQSICDHTYSHRARLVKPSIGFDASALALSFVPASPSNPSSSQDRKPEDDAFTYHHLRRSLYDLCSTPSTPVDSRYVVPSSHLTIGRFIDPKDFQDSAENFEPEKMKKFIEKIEEVNAWLEREYWPENNGGEIKDGGEWFVGEEKGLTCRMGTLWYGGGEEVYLGKGF